MWINSSAMSRAAVLFWFGRASVAPIACCSIEFVAIRAAGRRDSCARECGKGQPK
jgi:hypothetical protein